MKHKREIAAFAVANVSMSLAVGWMMTTYVLFLQDKGLSLLQANLLNVIYMSLSFLLDPLTGWLADKIGQKRVYLAGQLVWAGAMLIYGTGNFFWQFALAEATAAVGHVLMSEALESWLRNVVGQEKSKEQISKMGFWSKVIGLPGAVAGGWIGAKLGLQYPWLIGAGMGLIGWLITHLAMRGTVDGISHEEREKAGVNLKNVLAKSWQNPILRNTLVVSFLFFGFVTSFNMFWAPILKEVLGGQEWVGLIWVGVALFTAIGSWIANKLDHNHIWLVILATGAPILVTGSLGIPLGLLSGFWLHEIGRGALRPILFSWANREIDDPERSSANSIRSAVGTGGNALGLIVSGLLTTFLEPLQVWMIFSVGLILLALWTRKRLV